MRLSRRLLVLAAAAASLFGCSKGDERTQIYVQRFFGECGAVYGQSTDLSAAEGECGIITALFNRFNAENPDIHVEVNVVAWPGYAQLAAQIAAGDPPDLVTMHQGVIADYQSRGLLEPMDGILHAAGIRPEDFTDAARRGVSKAGHIWGLAWDNVGGLFHINTALFRQAGLMRGDVPILPTSPDELLRQARQFKARTGRPYLIQSQVNDPATHVRNFYTYMLGRNVRMFLDPRHVDFTHPEARDVVAFLKRLNDEGLSTLNQDTPAAIQSFMNGEGGIYPTGTWMIGSFDQEANTPGRPLYRSYAVYPYPRLWGPETSFVDGHSWVMPRRDHSPEQRRAIARLLRFMADHNFDWSRTGHLPAMRAVVESAQFRALPHRSTIAPIARTGTPLPSFVRRQAPIEGTLGEELSAAIAGQKSIDQALADAERRVNELLAQTE